MARVHARMRVRTNTTTPEATDMDVNSKVVMMGPIWFFPRSLISVSGRTWVDRI